MRDRGFAVEAYVANYLEQQGLELVSQNFNCKLGEIDLILKEQKTLVFTEVRYRKNSKFGGHAVAGSARAWIARSACCRRAHNLRRDLT